MDKREKDAEGLVIPTAQEIEEQAAALGADLGHVGHFPDPDEDAPEGGE